MNNGNRKSKIQLWQLLFMLHHPDLKSKEIAEFVGLSNVWTLEIMDRTGIKKMKRFPRYKRSEPLWRTLNKEISVNG